MAVHATPSARRVATNIALEPLADAVQTLDAVLRLAATRHAVALVGIAIELHHLAAPLERRKELLGLLNGQRSLLPGARSAAAFRCDQRS